MNTSSPLGESKQGSSAVQQPQGFITVQPAAAESHVCSQQLQSPTWMAI